jgi:LacI family transcriptional regulator
MAAVAGAERNGLTLGDQFDMVTKEAIHFLHRFRPDMYVAHEDVAQAGHFLATAVISAIEGRTALDGQQLEVPKLSDFRQGSSGE